MNAFSSRNDKRQCRIATARYWAAAVCCSLSLLVGVGTQRGPAQETYQSPAKVTSISSVASGLEREDLRRPLDLTFSADKRWIYVANRSGWVSVVSWRERRLLTEVSLGDSLSAIESLPDGRILVADQQAHRLILCDIMADGSLQQVATQDTPPYPVFLHIGKPKAANSTRDSSPTSIYVACLWPRRIVEFHYDGLLRRGRQVDLPFAPRNLVVHRDWLLAADSFGNQLAIVDRGEMKLRHVRRFPGHNLRGMIVTPTGKLVVAHQMLNELAHSVRNDVHWGLMMSNDLRWLDIDAVIDPAGDLYREGHMHPLGDASDGTADPAGLAMTGHGRVAVTLGGVGEVAIGVEEDFSLRRVKVGRRPTTVIAAPDDRHVVVANTFDDSISLVDTEALEETARISLGPQRSLSMTERGELLFYDASLSHDAWMSCHSCHPDGHTNNLRNDNFSDKSFGAPKRVLSLLGNRNTAPFAWSGETGSLDEQIRNSIMVTMQGDREPTGVEVEALRNFLWSFTPPPPIDVMRGERDDALVAAGAAVFRERGCVGCHVPNRYTSPDSYDVGMVDEQGNREFNPPSLRGASQRRGYFHDNRAATLEDVIQEFQHQLDKPLTEKESRALLAFLRSL